MADRRRGGKPNYSKEVVEDDLVTCIIPTAGIDPDVIQAELQTHLGPEAAVSRRDHPDGVHKGTVYWIRAYNTLTVHMISDLKRDTLDWQDERRKGRIRDYRDSKTHELRQRNRGKKAVVHLDERSGPVSIPTPQKERSEDDDRRAGPDSKSRLSTSHPRQDYFPGRSDSLFPRQQSRSEYDRLPESAADPRTVKGSGPRPSEYVLDTRGGRQAPDSRDIRQAPDPRDTRQAPDSRDTRQAPDPRDTRQAPDPRDTRQAPDSRDTRQANSTVPRDRAQVQSIPTREDITQAIVQRLKDEGKKNVTRKDLDQFVDEAMRSVNQRFGSQPGSTSQPDRTGTRMESTFVTAPAKKGEDYDPRYNYDEFRDTR